MKNLILLFVLFAALFAAIPAEASCGVGFQSFGVQSFGFVPSGFGVRSFTVLDNRPIVINGGGGRFEQREFRGVFGARRSVIRNF